MKYHVRGWATLFVSTEWVPKVNLLQNGRLRGSTQAFFLPKWQDKPGICYRMVIYVSRKRIVSGPSARKCPLQDGRTLNEIFTSIHPNSDSSDVVPRMLCLFFLPSIPRLSVCLQHCSSVFNVLVTQGISNHQGQNQKPTDTQRALIDSAKKTWMISEPPITINRLKAR